MDSVKVTKKDLERKVKDSISPSDTIIKATKNPKKAFLEGKVRQQITDKKLIKKEQTYYFV
jgi:hypothetical protein